MLVFIAIVALIIVAGVVLSQTKKAQTPAEKTITPDDILPPVQFIKDSEMISEEITKTEHPLTFVKEGIMVPVEVKAKSPQKPKKNKPKKKTNRGK